MTKELQGLGLNVGHRRIGRLIGENSIKIIRTQNTRQQQYPRHWQGDDLRHVSNDVIRDVFYAGCAMRGEILEAERPRFWHDDDKPEIVMSVGVDRASVTQVAQRHVISRQ